MSDVCIIGAGIHPFGRTDALSGLQQGVFAARQALEDSGVAWADVEIAYGGSSAAGNADIMVNDLGLTGVPFINVANGCATGGSALFGAFSAIKAGQAEIALAVGFDKHPRGAFDPRPADWGLPDWYGETGLMLTTQFFALKLRRYMEQLAYPRAPSGWLRKRPLPMAHWPRTAGASSRWTSKPS
jgi:acetyl-CoA acetyltransferase